MQKSNKIIKIFLAPILLIGFFTLIHFVKKQNIQIENKNNIKIEQPENKNPDTAIKQDTSEGVIPHKHIGDNFQTIKIDNGMNKIDLNNDGILDMIFVTTREKGSSPHWYDIYNFAVYAPQLPIFGSDSKESYWHSAIVWKGYKDSKDDNTMYYDILTASEDGTGVATQAIRLIKVKSQQPILVIANRNLNGSYSEPTLVSFNFYGLVENTKAEDWSSNYYYKYRDTAITDNKYSDVNEAIEKELVNKY